MLDQTVVIAPGREKIEPAWDSDRTETAKKSQTSSSITERSGKKSKLWPEMWTTDTGKQMVLPVTEASVDPFSAKPPEDMPCS